MAKTPPQPPADDPDTGPDDQTLSMFGDTPSDGASRDSGRTGAYQVLARKYRPRTFEDLVGQEAMVRTLTNAFRTGRIAHAFMLTGVRGVGKTTTARLLARSLNYETASLKGPSIMLDPPGVHCASIMASQHPDVLELDAASHNGVENMRDLLSGARYAPVSARYKVYIIDEVHMLSTPAFNALLKTLEEPPPHVKFIFATTEIRKVPVTVLSRCQRFNLQRFTTDALAEHLANICAKEKVAVAPDALALIARAAEGSARDGLSILDQAMVQSSGGGEISGEIVRDMLGLADRSRILDLLEKAVGGEHRAALTEAEALLTAGADPAVLVKDLMDAMTEVSRAQALGDAYSYAGPPDWAARTRAMAARLSPAQAARMWRLLLQGFEDCGRAPDPSAAAGMVVLRLAAAAALPPPEDAARYLQGQRTGASAAGASAPGSSAPPPRESAGPVATYTQGALAQAAQPHPEVHPGVHLASLRDVLSELDARRNIDLKWLIERYVRPAEIDYGHFRYTAAPGAPADLSFKIKLWLETVTGVEWEVLQANDGAAESPAELRKRRKQEKLDSATSHPRIAEALKLFPGARVVSVEAPGDDDLQDELPAASNVIHVEFGGARSPAAPAPVSFGPILESADPEEDDE